MKISIILPIYNVEKYLKRSLDSLLNQSIGMENIEVIMVDDVSSDSSGKIIDEYASKYDNFIAIHHETNSGGCAEPRNTGLKYAKGDYIMFLDSDDNFDKDCCKNLYEAIKKYDADISFGNYRRIYPFKKITQKSFSLYKNKVEEHYPDEKIEEFNPLHMPNFLWKFFKRIMYGKNIQGSLSRDIYHDEIYIENIKDEPDLLKMSPSIWTKMYKRELLIDNNIDFVNILGEDQLFILESYFNAKGIVYLPNYFCYDYYIRDFPEDSSIINTVNINLLVDLLDVFKKVTVICIENDFNNYGIIIKPHLFHWLSLWKKGNFTKEENNIFIEKLENLKKVYAESHFISFIISLIKFSNLIK